MFEDWCVALSSLDVASADEVTVRGWLSGLAGLRAAVDGLEARAAACLGEASVVRGAMRCTQREADRAVARGKLIEELPDVGDALAAGAISGARVDVLVRAAERTSVGDVAGSDLLALAGVKPADAMAKQVADFVRAKADREALAERLERQRNNRRGALLAKEMGVLHAEFDDVTFGQVRAAVDAETDRLFRLDGGRDGAAALRSPQQRRADAIASLLTRTRAGGADAEAAGPPAVRNQMLVVAQVDGTGEIPGVGPLPASEVARLACVSDLYGLVFDGDGQPCGTAREGVSDGLCRSSSTNEVVT